MSTLLQHSVVISLQKANSYKEAKAILDGAGYTNLGWVNDHRTIIGDHYHLDTVYRNRSGSSCIDADHTWRVYCSIDMGD